MAKSHRFERRQSWMRTVKKLKANARETLESVQKFKQTFARHRTSEISWKHGQQTWKTANRTMKTMQTKKVRSQQPHRKRKSKRQSS